MIDMDIYPIEEYARQKLAGALSSNDWWHTARVRAAAMAIAKAEGGDLEVVEAAALLHDTEVGEEAARSGAVDHAELAAAKSRELLAKLGWPAAKTEAVVHAIDVHRFSKRKAPRTLEAKILRDADRLDAMGAIGTARNFAFGGAMGRELWDPSVAPDAARGREGKFVKGGKGTSSLNHFYEKLLLVKDLLETKTGRQMAGGRHEFMLAFIDQFKREWTGER